MFTYVVRPKMSKFVINDFAKL